MQRERIRTQIESYLTAKGIDTNRPFRCLNPAHEDKNPSMRFDRKRHKAHCFSCGVDYDIFDLIGIDYGLSDHKSMFQKAYELFDANSTNTAFKSEKQPLHSKPTEIDLTGYFKRVQQHISQTDYPQKRGLSTETIQRFGLGYDSQFKTGGATWQAVIIPTGPSSYVARNTDPNADSKNRIRKQGSSQIFNAQALQTAQKPVFVVEGEFDALSICEMGGQAVALGSTANVKRFLQLIENDPPSQPLLIALDNDEAGQKAAEDLSIAINGLYLPFYRVFWPDPYKDANDMLKRDREEFKRLIFEAEQMHVNSLAQQCAAYRQNSAAAHIDGFLQGVADSINTPCISTGFDKLDQALDGGFFEGLYIVGAISSLGKTTLVTQIADQIAQTNRDVLLISLEMARTEIMAKSISRLTLELTLRGGGSVQTAKSCRGITSGARYLNYTAAEHKLIADAVQAYRAFADRIFIFEGVGDIGTRQVRELVQRHIDATGQAPVVVIDYMQILAPHNDRASDKQNTDKAVLELKRISRDFKTPVIGISSFNRARYKDAVSMEAFKESGAIEYSSDVLIGLQLEGAGECDFDVDQAKSQNPRDIELVILKNRNGPTGCKVAYRYYPLFNYFEEV